MGFPMENLIFVADEDTDKRKAKTQVIQKKEIRVVVDNDYENLLPLLEKQRILILFRKEECEEFEDVDEEELPPKAWQIKQAEDWGKVTKILERELDFG